MVISMKKLFAVWLALALLCTLLAGCQKASGGEETSCEKTSFVASDEPAAPAQVDFSQNTDADMFTDRDQKPDYDADGSVRIQLNGTSATASSDSVRIDGTTITLTADATYVISGTLEDGMLIVDAPDSAKLQLVFDGVNINSATSAPLYIRAADKVFLTLAEGTENTLSNGGSFTPIDENNIDAAIFSKQDLTVNGVGSLTVTSPAGHGIVSKDDLVITGGHITVASASHGLDANDSVRIANASVTVDAGKDGIRAKNDEDASRGFVYLTSGTLDIEAEGDGISASAYVQIENGTIRVLAGGGSENGTKSSSESFGGFMGGPRPGGQPPQGRTSSSSNDGTSMKGIKARGSLLISDGSITINSADDAIHSNASVVINGGTFEIASGDDGIHADDTLTVTAGKINITESYEGLEAQHVVIQGGEITLSATDDGINAAGGKDSSGTSGGRDGLFGGGPGGGPGGGGFGGSSSSNGSIVISGGKLYIKAYGDGIDANGTLEITGGHTTVVGPTQGDTATLDYDISGTISGGTFIGTGAAGMAQSFSASTQGVIAVRVSTQSAGTNVTLKDKSGNTIVSYAPELPFAVVILSSPDIVSGETYTISVGSNSSDFKAS